MYLYFIVYIYICNSILKIIDALLFSFFFFFSLAVSYMLIMLFTLLFSTYFQSLVFGEVCGGGGGIRAPHRGIPIFLGFRTLLIQTLK